MHEISLFRQSSERGFSFFASGISLRRGYGLFAIQPQFHLRELPPLHLWKRLRQNVSQHRSLRIRFLRGPVVHQHHPYARMRLPHRAQQICGRLAREITIVESSSMLGKENLWSQLSCEIRACSICSGPQRTKEFISNARSRDMKDDGIA